MSNWTGNRKSTYSCLGASNHSDSERVNKDFYATNPLAIDALLSTREEFANIIWEPACGNGHLSKRLEELLPDTTIVSSDIEERDFPCEVFDFLNGSLDTIDTPFDIITNPPYKYALEFAEKALERVKEGQKVAFFLKLTFLESEKRRKFFQENPPKTVYVFSKRISVARNGDPKMFNQSSAVCYAWFVWVKGNKEPPIIKWI